MRKSPKCGCHRDMRVFFNSCHHIKQTHISMIIPPIWLLLCWSGLCTCLTQPCWCSLVLLALKWITRAKKATVIAIGIEFLSVTITANEPLFSTSLSYQLYCFVPHLIHTLLLYTSLQFCSYHCKNERQKATTNSFVQHWCILYIALLISFLIMFLWSKLETVQDDHFWVFNDFLRAQNIATVQRLPLPRSTSRTQPPVLPCALLRVEQWKVQHNRYWGQYWCQQRSINYHNL